MPISWTMDRDLHLLRAKIEGNVTWGEIVEYLATIQRLFPEPPDAILDVTGARSSDISHQQVMELARGPRKYARVAIVTGQPAQFGLARMYQLAAEVQPERKVSCVVTSQEEALAWLRGETPAVRDAAG